MIKDKVKKYTNNYAGVLHHILDLHKEGYFTGAQYYYAMDQIKKIIKEERYFERR